MDGDDTDGQTGTTRHFASRKRHSEVGSRARCSFERRSAEIGRPILQCARTATVPSGRHQGASCEGHNTTYCTHAGAFILSMALTLSAYSWLSRSKVKKRAWKRVCVWGGHHSPNATHAHARAVNAAAQRCAPQGRSHRCVRMRMNGHARNAIIPRPGACTLHTGAQPGRPMTSLRGGRRTRACSCSCSPSPPGRLSRYPRARSQLMMMGMRWHLASQRSASWCCAERSVSTLRSTILLSVTSPAHSPQV